MRVKVSTLGGFGVVFLLAVRSLGAASDARLAEAVKHQDTEAVRALLEQQVDVSAPAPDGATALHWAAFWDDLATAGLLMRAGADVIAANDYGVTPLSIACTNGKAPMVETLLAAGAYPNLGRTTGETPLMTCARTGSVDAVHALLAQGGDVHAREIWQEQTALMWAVAEGHAPVVQALIEHGADVRARSKVRPQRRLSADANRDGHAPEEGGFTSLLFAARAGRLDTAQMLLAAGADVNEMAADGNTALLVATVRGHMDLATFLLDQGADPNADGPGYTALHWAAGLWETELTSRDGIAADRDDEWRALAGLPTGKVEFVRTLLSHGANPNAPGVMAPPRFGFTPGVVTMDPGTTALLLAAMAGDVSVMRVLLANGANSRLASNDGTTPLMVAAGLGRSQMSSVTESDALEAVELALDLGADVNAANKAGNTALHGAASKGLNAIVRRLADAGATVTGQNTRGQTPLDMASPTPLRTGFPSTIALLRELGGQ